MEIENVQFIRLPLHIYFFFICIRHSNVHIYSDEAHSICINFYCLHVVAFVCNSKAKRKLLERNPQLEKFPNAMNNGRIKNSVLVMCRENTAD